MMASPSQRPPGAGSKRASALFVVEDEDARWFLEDEEVPETALHDLIIDLLAQVLRGWIAREGRDAMVARNLACRWDPQDARVGMDPDLVLVEPAPPEGESLVSLRVFDPGHRPPRLAFEVVSPSTAGKDYVNGPLRASRLGVEELWIFDPTLCGPAETGGPYRLQVFRRSAGADGTVRRVYAGEGPVRSEGLKAWLVTTDGGGRLRLADDPAGRRLWPTPAEAEAKRADSESQRAEQEAKRAEHEAKRAESAERALAELRARSSGSASGSGPTRGG